MAMHYHQTRSAAHSTRRARIDNWAPCLILWGHSSPECFTDSSYRATRARSCGLGFDALNSQSTVRLPGGRTESLCQTVAFALSPTARSIFDRRRLGYGLIPDRTRVQMIAGEMAFVELGRIIPIAHGGIEIEGSIERNDKNSAMSLPAYAPRIKSEMPLRFQKLRLRRQ